MKNIILIGMPGAGKSTIGVLLAKTMLLNFVDTDLLIQDCYKSSLCNIISKNGIKNFLQIENNVIKSYSFQNSVVATGGSAIYGNEAMKNLKSNGIVIYLKLDIGEIKKRINNITTRGIVMNNNESLDDVYYKRIPLYQQNANIIIDCNNLTIEECVLSIIENIKLYNKN